MKFTNYIEKHGYEVLNFKTDGGLELELFYKDGESHSIETKSGVVFDWKDKQTLSNLYISYENKMYTLLHVLSAGELALPDIKAEDEQDGREYEEHIKSITNMGRYI